VASTSRAFLYRRNRSSVPLLTTLRQTEQSGHRLAVQVCNATADKLQRHVCQHFTDIIVSNSNHEDFSEIRVAHELIKRLHHSCPGLLHGVIPQLEEELRVEDATLRLIATQTLGEMFTDKGGSDLVKKYPATWNIWVLRKNDKSAAIRLAFVDVARGLLINLPEQREIIEGQFPTSHLTEIVE
jgi:sister-chromatid-cohesion protein PDS5